MALEGAGSYDDFVDWDARLGREAPFFRELFARHAVKRVVDVGCGTGRHAVLFGTWGMRVVGVDPAPDMLESARAHAVELAGAVAGAGGAVDFREGGFGGVAELLDAPVDALTCTGNALPHVNGLPGLRSALADFACALRPGGVLVLHLLNHDRLLAGCVRTIPPVVREAEDGTRVFLRVMDYEEGAIRFDFLTLWRPAGAWDAGTSWEVSSRRSVHAALPSAVLSGELAHAGFADVRLWGDHERKPFDAGVDESVIITAMRA